MVLESRSRSVTSSKSPATAALTTSLPLKPPYPAPTDPSVSPPSQSCKEGGLSRSIAVAKSPLRQAFFDQGWEEILLLPKVPKVNLSLSGAEQQAFAVGQEGQRLNSRMDEMLGDFGFCAIAPP